MVLSLFKKSYFVQISWVIIFSILLAIPSFLQTDTVYIPQTTLFSKIICLYPWLKINWIYQIVSYFALLSLAFYIKNVLAENSIIDRQNFMPSLIVLLLFNVFHPYQYQLLSIVYLFLISISVSFLFKSFEDEKPDNSIFTASLLISLASLISYSAFFVFPIIWISFLVFKNLSIRYFFNSLVGLISPYIFLISYFFWCNKMEMLYLEIDALQSNLFQIAEFSGLLNIIILVLLVFFAFISVTKIMSNISSKVIEIRLKTILFIWLFVSSMYVFIFFPDIISNNLIILAFSAFLGHYLVTIKRHQLWIDIAFTILIVLILINKYANVTEVFLK